MNKKTLSRMSCICRQHRLGRIRRMLPVSFYGIRSGLRWLTAVRMVLSGIALLIIAIPGEGRGILRIWTSVATSCGFWHSHCLGC